MKIQRTETTPLRLKLLHWFLLSLYGIAPYGLSKEAPASLNLPDLPGASTSSPALVPAKLPNIPNPNMADPMWDNARQTQNGLMGGRSGNMQSGMMNEGGVSNTPGMMSAPSVPLQLNDNTTVNVGPSATGVQYQGKSLLFDVNVGAGYLRPDNTANTPIPFTASARMAALLRPNFALGTNFNISRVWSEAVLNAVYRIPEMPFLLSASGGYAIGRQNFDFDGVPLGVKLGQASYLLGGTYLPPTSERYLGLQSVSVQTWGAKAHQRTGNIADPTTTVEETDTAYLLSTNNYKLSLGSLFGTSVGGQFALAENVILKASLGFENIRYPFSDGSSERNSSVYRSVEGFYQPSPLHDLILGGLYKGGAAENRMGLSATTNGITLAAFISRGVNGSVGNRGVTVNYSLPLGGSVSSGRSKTTLAERMKPVTSTNSSGLLNLAGTRPTELPQVFLAKVDLTANRRIGIAKACMDSDVTVDAQGVASVPIGPSPIITGVTRNGAAYSYDPIFKVQGNNLLMNIVTFPVPVSTDNYIALLTDATGTSYQVFLTGTRSSSTVCAQ